jgi:hypothetical protein
MYIIPFARERIRSGLKDFYPSKETYEMAKRVERQWASDELVCLTNFGCKTSKDAIEYIIKNQLTGANLKAFTKLNNDKLKYLLENCPNLEKLFIDSYEITSFPATALNLKTLIIRSNLQSLPELPQLQVLDCRACPKLQTLPEFPQLQLLDCSLNANLQSLPKLPQVREIRCNACPKLDSLAELPKLEKLDCDDLLKGKVMGFFPNVKIT